MSYIIKGEIKVIEDEQTFDSGFVKRLFVVTTEGDYPQDIPFELIKDKTSILDRYKVGQLVEVSFNLKGNEWNGKYYVNLTCWKLIAQGGSSTNEAPVQAKPTSKPTATEEELDDLPF